MERESQVKSLKLKNRLGELNTLVREIAESIGETKVETAFPTGIRDYSLITLEENGNKVNWWRYDNDYYMVITGETPIEYFEKDIKDVKLMLLKEFQEKYMLQNKDILDDIERLKLRIKEKQSIRRVIPKWVKVKQLIEELE